MNEAYRYAGSELELFRDAVHWKNTLRRQIQPFLSGDVLEVGAGMGGTTRVLRSGQERSWTCLEPDQTLANTISGNGGPVEVIVGSLTSLSADTCYDSILYVDVLEHIKRDVDEMKMAAARLNPGGYLIVLSPAHQWLFSAFDQEIGHYRRYNRRSLRRLAPSGLREVRMAYLDSVGLLASLASKLLLSQPQPKPSQIWFWDSFLVRASRIMDPLTGYNAGKSVLAVWQRGGRMRN